MFDETDCWIFFEAHNPNCENSIQNQSVHCYSCQTIVKTSVTWSLMRIPVRKQRPSRRAWPSRYWQRPRRSWPRPLWRKGSCGRGRKLRHERPYQPYRHSCHRAWMAWTAGRDQQMALRMETGDDPSSAAFSACDAVGICSPDVPERTTNIINRKIKTKINAANNKTHSSLLTDAIPQKNFQRKETVWKSGYLIRTICKNGTKTNTKRWLALRVTVTDFNRQSDYSGFLLNEIQCHSFLLAAKDTEIRQKLALTQRTNCTKWKNFKNSATTLCFDNSELFCGLPRLATTLEFLVFLVMFSYAHGVFFINSIIRKLRWEKHSKREQGENTRLITTILIPAAGQNNAKTVFTTVFLQNGS